MTRRNGVMRRFGPAAMALSFIAMSREAGAIERKGFIESLGIGVGKITCNGCRTLNGGAAAFVFGGMLSKKLALVFDGSAVVKDLGEDHTLTSVLASAALQYWVSPRVWVKGGAGGAMLGDSAHGIDTASDSGLGFLGAVGVEVAQKKKFAIDFHVRYTTAKIGGIRTNNLAALVGFDSY